MSRTILCNEEIEYEVVHSSKATIPRIDISLNGIKVVVPEASDKDPETFLKKKADKVLKKKKEFDKYREQIPERNFQEGEWFPYRGEEFRITVKNDVENYRVGDKEIVLSKEKIENSSLKKALASFYKEEATKMVKRSLEKFSGDINVEYNKVRFKNQKTRWGSCSPKKNLNFNWRMAMMPQKIVDYLVLHELVHLKESNHTKKFWLKLSQVMPDYKEKIKWLEENSPKLIFSENDY